MAPNPGPNEGWIAKEAAVHRAKLQRSSVEDNPTLEEDDLNKVDVENACDVKFALCSFWLASFSFSFFAKFP